MKEEKKIQRPLIISIACYVLFAWGLATIIYSFTGIYSQYGNLYSALNAMCILGIFTSMAGVLNMEKWGVRLYALMMLIKWSADYGYGAFSFWEMLLVFPLLLFFWHWKEFR